MLYKSYKQLYRLVLNSANATTETITKVMDGGNVDVVTKYHFKLNIELPFTTTARLAVKTFYCNIFSSYYIGSTPLAIGSVYSPTLSQRNIYQSIGNQKGTHLLSMNFNSLIATEYSNPHYEMNYIDIQNNTSWLTEGIDIIVDTKILDDASADIGGCPNVDSWQLELLIYDD